MSALAPIRLRLIAEARALVGARFHWHGRERHALDCYGLLVVAGRAAGLDVPDTHDYSRLSVGDRARGALLGRFAALSSAEIAEPGDVVEIHVRRRPQHYGVISERGTMVHANIAARRVTESRLTDENWRDVVAAYRFPGVAHG